MRSVLVALLLAAPSTFLAGCVECDPQAVPAQVTLGRTAEEVRTLPILASGATRLVGIDVPDSHGRLEIQVNITHNLASVDLDDLRILVTVAGQSVPVRLLAVDGGRGFASDDEGRSWAGTANAGTRLVLWWAVDRTQVASAAALALAEGAAYRARVTFTWSHESCSFRAQGSVDQSFDDVVEASVNARTFQAGASPFLTMSATGAGFRANFTTKSGLEATVTAVEAKAVVLGIGSVGSLALVTFPTTGWNVDGLPGDVVKPGQTLRTHSAANALAKGTYAASGTVAGTMPTGGLAILLVDLTYTPKDATPGTPKDTFAFALPR